MATFASATDARLLIADIDMIRQNSVPYRIPVPNNMGVVRYILAIGIVLGHFKGQTQWNIPLPYTTYAIVGAFFVLSGFLSFGSYLRDPSPRRYIVKRLKRLMPPYWVAVLFFALILCSVSELSAAQYFTSPHFWKYLVSNLLCLNFIEPSLPGVFTDVAFNAVNGSLWTMKVEILLTLLVPVVHWITVKARCAPVWIFAGIYMLSCLYRGVMEYMYYVEGLQSGGMLSRQFAGQLMYFYFGVIVYYYFDTFMRYKWWLLGFTIALLLVSGAVPFYIYRVTAAPLVIGTAVIWFSMVGRWGIWEGRRDNVAYNIFLLHFPLVQLTLYFGLPSLVGHFAAFLICVAVSVVLAALMNLAVERPLQKLWKCF